MPILIDGYNLLRYMQASDEQFEVLNEVGLCRIISLYLSRIRSNGQIIFDGFGPMDKSDLSGFGNLEVYFSGQDTEADEIIEEKILINTAPKRLMVVSTDRRIRAAASHRKAISVRSDLFFYEVEKVLDRKMMTPEPKEKRSGLTEAEAEQWIDFFDLD
jgi:predicted RNA-binding protein with PIN domain